MINSASESKSMESQFHWKKKINNISFFVKFLSLVEIRQKNAFLEEFTAFFKKCYEFLDFASFDSFKEVTFFASILLVFPSKVIEKSSMDSVRPHLLIFNKIGAI